MVKRVVFSDLDGCLLDKNNYKFDKAEQALNILKEQKIPLILVSSKTRAEIDFYRKKLGNKHPFISENGGGIFIPKNYFSKENFGKLIGEYNLIKLGIDYKKLIEVLEKIGKKINIKGFSKMSVKELSKNSGLSLKEAKLAKKREFDEAFILENKKDYKMLIKLIHKYRLNLTKGGRYYHILGNNDKGKAVKILIDFYKREYKDILSIGLGDAENDKPMLKTVDKGFLIKSSKEWNKKIISFLGMDKEFIRNGEKLYKESLKVLKQLQLGNGAILASPPKSRYPYVYPRDHSICILSFIEVGEFKKAKKALNFILNSQNKEGSFPQRLNKKGEDASYKPIQLDNIGLVLLAFAKYINSTGDKKFLKVHKKKIKKSINYLKSQLNKKKQLFFTPNSIHEFPPLEKGLEVWANAVCYSGLKELEKAGIKTSFDLKKLKNLLKSIFGMEVILLKILD